jgi:hypothetical protein
MCKHVYKYTISISGLAMFKEDEGKGKDKIDPERTVRNGKDSGFLNLTSFLFIFFFFQKKKKSHTV